MRNPSPDLKLAAFSIPVKPLKVPAGTTSFFESIIPLFPLQLQDIGKTFLADSSFFRSAGCSVLLVSITASINIPTVNVPPGYPEMPVNGNGSGLPVYYGTHQVTSAEKEFEAASGVPKKLPPDLFFSCMKFFSKTIKGIFIHNSCFYDFSHIIISLLPFTL